MIKSYKCRPWGSNGIENGNDGRYINSSPLGNLNFRNDNSCGQHNTIQHKCNNVCYNLPDKEEAIDYMYFLPQRHFLHKDIKTLDVR